MRTIWVWALGLGVMIAGCVYEVPLATESRQDVDKALLGKWQTTDADGTVQELLVLPLSAREYLVHYPSNSKDGIYFRAFVAQTGEQPIMQFQALGTSAGDVPDDQRVYHFGAFRLDGPQLVLRLLNPEVVSREVKTSEALAKAIADQRQNPALFGDPTVFGKLPK
jgi:hypothetical protein